MDSIFHQLYISSVDKAQGQTLSDGVILALAYRNGIKTLIDYEKLFIALTRIIEASHLRFLADTYKDIFHLTKLTPTILTVINNWLCQAKNNKLLFGEIPIILCGDFRQAPPIQGMSLTNVVVQINNMINNNNF